MQPSSLGLTPTERVERCPSCERAQLRLFERFPHFGIPLEYQICRYCGLVFMSPRFSESDLAEFYRTTYREVVTTGASDEKNVIEEGERARHLAQLVLSSMGAVGSHLDIGCSSGCLLSAIREQTGCARSIGVEPTDRLRDRTVRSGLTVVAALDAVARPDDGFQLITLSHVLEHLTDPLGYLQRLRRDYLAPRGHVLIEVPNLMGHRSFEVSHQFCFWPKTLRDLLTKAGFELVALKAHGIPRSATDTRYITAIATPRRDGAAPPPIRFVPWFQVKLQRVKAIEQRSWVELAARGLWRGPRSVWRALTR